MTKDLTNLSHQIGFLKSLTIFYFGLSAVVLCLLNLRFDIVFIGGLFFLAVSFLTGNTAYREIMKCDLLRRRIIIICVLDVIVSIVAVYVFPILFVVKFLLGVVYFIVVANHEIVAN